MSDAPASAPSSRVRTRAQLLHVLHDDPRSVSREEIKAAFADGRLGDQDLDIPVLAGMRRITELLAELQPDAAGSTEAAGPVGGAGASDATAHAAPRSSAMTTRLSELEERVGTLEAHAAEPPAPVVPSPTVGEVADLRASLARLEASLAGRDRRTRQLAMLVVVSLGLAAAALLLALLVH